MEEADESWEEISLDSIINIVSGYNHNINELKNYGDFLLSMGSVIKSYGIDLSNTRRINKNNIEKKYLCKCGDIIIPTRDITQNAELLGSPGIVPKFLKDRRIIIGS